MKSKVNCVHSTLVSLMPFAPPRVPSKMRSLWRSIFVVHVMESRWLWKIPLKGRKGENLSSNKISSYKSLWRNHYPLSVIFSFPIHPSPSGPSYIVTHCPPMHMLIATATNPLKTGVGLAENITPNSQFTTRFRMLHRLAWDYFSKLSNKTSSSICAPREQLLCARKVKL